jgi:hypothetical protein
MDERKCKVCIICTAKSRIRIGRPYTSNVEIKIQVRLDSSPPPTFERPLKVQYYVTQLPKKILKFPQFCILGRGLRDLSNLESLANLYPKLAIACPACR